MHIKYAEINLSHNRPLITELDKMLGFIKGKNLTKTIQDRDLTREHMAHRTSAAVLPEVIARPNPLGDFYMVNFRHFDFPELTEEVKKAFEEEVNIKEYEKLIVMGKNWFPAGGYMGWHDDNKYKGYRLYCVYAEDDNKSFFRYRDYETNEIITSWEKAGWNFRVFYIHEESEKRLWHCVYTDTLRVSIGHRFVV